MEREERAAYLVDLLVRAGDTEAVETELLVRVALPTHGGGRLDGQCRDAVGDDLQSVRLVLRIEDLEAGDGDNTGNDAVLLLQVLGGIDTDAHLGARGNDGDGSVRSLQDDVATLEGILDGGVLELGQVLAGEGEDGGGVLGGQGGVVGSAGLVAVSWTPDHAVGQGTEVRQGLDRLVGRTVLSQTDRVVGRDVDDANVRESGQADGARGVRDEVEESTTGGDDGTVGGETVHDSGHGMLTHTVADVATSPVTDAILWRLEVDGVLPAGVVGASQVSRAGHKLGNGIVDLLEDSLGQLAGGDSGVSRLVGWQVLLPALRQLAGQTAHQVSMLFRVRSSVLLEEVVPLLLLGSTLGRVLAVEVVDLLGDDEALLRVETEELLDALGVVRLQGVTVHTAGTLQLGTVANGGGQLDDGRLVLDGLAPADRGLDAVKVVVTVLDPLGVPAVGLETLHDILGEGALGVTI